jgi:NAD/NADP transhydrogenase beta subunit
VDHADVAVVISLLNALTSLSAAAMELALNRAPRLRSTASRSSS